MKYSIIFIALTIILGACSSSVETNSNPNAANTSSVNSINANSLGATNSNPTLQPYNGIQNLNPNAFNVSNSNSKVVKYVPKPGELPYGSRNAPDDSVITSMSRGTDFFEIRTFKNDPVLSKVEKIMDGKTTKFKVYLKNGKIVEAPAEKMDNFAAIAPANILEAIGVAPKTTPNSQPKTEDKKDQKQ